MYITAVADVNKEQTDMSYKGELQTLTKLSVRQQVCPGVTCRTYNHIRVHYNHVHRVLLLTWAVLQLNISGPIILTIICSNV